MMNPSFWFGLAVGLLMVIMAVIVVARRNARRIRLSDERAKGNERLAELGTLAGGLAHEIKNPLSSVNLNIQLLQEDLKDLHNQVEVESGLAERIGRITRRFDSLSRESRRLRDILDDFLRFAGRMMLDKTPVDLNLMIDELVDFFTPQADAFEVTIRPQLSTSLGAVSADEALLKQAVLNLMINGCQAMADARESDTQTGGAVELIIRTAAARQVGQRVVQIHITDTGPGIEADQIDRIFHPYISTKKSGTGLGLPTSRRIVEEHGGTLTVLSEPGRGSDFVITLPAEQDDD
jgi:signal transduction histidine kinase